MSSLPARPVSPPEPGAQYLAEIREQPAALRRLLAHRAEYADAVAEAATPRARHRAHGRPRLVRQRRGVRRLRVRAPARADGDARLDQPDRLLRRQARPRRQSTVLALSQSGQTPDVLEYVTRARRERRVHDRRSRTSPTPISRTPPRSSCPLAAGTSSRSPRRRPTRTRSPRSRSSPGCIAGRGDEVAGQLESGRRTAGTAASRARAGGLVDRRPVRLGRPDVRDRARARVRDCPRDRAEAARDLPDRRRASDRDRPRARSGRRARLTLPGLGGRHRRRVARCRRRGGRPGTRRGGDADRERPGRGRDRRRPVPAARADAARAAARAAAVGGRAGSSSPARSPARRGSIRTSRAACRRSRSRSRV